MIEKEEHKLQGGEGGTISSPEKKTEDRTGSIVWAIYIIALLVFIGLIIAVLNF